MNSKITSISNFSQIEIIPNSLIVLDIDETILTFDYKSKKINIPIKLDSENFNNFIKVCKKTGCKIILLTARFGAQHDETIQNLKDIEFRINSNKIFYSIKKGEKLLELVNDKYKYIENIIFIDDFAPNLKDVEKAFGSNQYKLNLYLITHELVKHYNF